MPSYHLPTRPYSPIDALNRRAAALGSPRYAAATSHANYNGHHVTLAWNDYRRYYVAEYYWAGRMVIARGSFAACLAAVLAEYNQGALGSSASVYPRDDDHEAIALCDATKELVQSEKMPEDSWYTWRHACASQGARDCANPMALHLIFDWELMQAVNSEQEYIEALRAKHGRAYSQ